MLGGPNNAAWCLAPVGATGSLPAAPPPGLRSSWAATPPSPSSPSSNLLPLLLPPCFR